jgi:hypothetical protein
MTHFTTRNESESSVLDPFRVVEYSNAI